MCAHKTVCQAVPSLWLIGTALFLCGGTTSVDPARKHYVTQAPLGQEPDTMRRWSLLLVQRVSSTLKGGVWLPDSFLVIQMREAQGLSVEPPRVCLP